MQNCRAVNVVSAFTKSIIVVHPCWASPSLAALVERNESGMGAVVGVLGTSMAYRQAPDGWWQKFVSAFPARTAKLAVVRKDGSPLVAPVWVDLDGDGDAARIVFMTSADTIKGKSILRDGRVSMCFDDEQPPFAFVTISGTTTTSTDPDELLEWSTRIASRYMGPVRADAYGRRNAVPPEMVVWVTPTNVVAKVDVAD
jgi:PPOX class probable F420-dependent enzyme